VTALGLLALWVLDGVTAPTRGPEELRAVAFLRFLQARRLSDLEHDKLMRILSTPHPYSADAGRQKGTPRWHH
jgi:hypothetical protein